MRIVETRRIVEARRLLAELGFDRERTNARSAATLLALAEVDDTTSWADAANPMLTTRQLMDRMSASFHIEYKPNSRETIRRQTLHQFVDASLVETNPDDPSRTTNSPKFCYRLTAEALGVVQAYAQPSFRRVLPVYLSKKPGLRDLYARARELKRIPVRLPDGSTITLSPGGQNVLIERILLDFCAYFVPGGQVLYIGDADEKLATFNKDRLRELDVVLDEHGKMPDLVVHDEDKEWLFLIEAVTSHGPIDAKRYRELERMFNSSRVDLVYVSCFADRASLRRFAADISWETEVWCADSPTHLIHFNGDKFLGPHVE